MDWTDAYNLSVDAAQIDAVRVLPEVTWAREHCRRIVLSAVYYASNMSMASPLSHKTVPAGCWLVFVSNRGHYTPGWTKVDGALARGDYPRSAHLVKIIPPLLFSQPVCYMDFKLTHSRTFADGPLFRALNTSRHPAVGVFMVYHPRFASTSIDREFADTYTAMRRRHMSQGVFHDLAAQLGRIGDLGSQ